jgi:predicted nucleic acid-binding protein
MYILDTNTLITSKNHDFPFGEVPSFWEWLGSMIEEGIVYFPEIVCKEIEKGKDELSDWLKRNVGTKRLPDKTALPFVGKVLVTYQDQGQAINMKDLEKIENDALIIAHALACVSNGQETTIVSYEKPRMATRPGKKKIPAISSELGVPCISFPAFLWKALN